MVTGKNGAGKSTLLQMVTGDCPQCFSNDVTVFGFQRGNGETIWDIKKHIGIVSSDLHRSYRVRSDALTVIASGFFDSIGLYKQISQYQLNIALQWLRILGLEAHQETLFQDLSYGEQRLLLIARALVKSPLLLVMDEPTQGLDDINRIRVLALLEKIATTNASTILYVSHREDEQLPLFSQCVKMS